MGLGRLFALLGGSELILNAFVFEERQGGDVG